MIHHIVILVIGMFLQGGVIETDSMSAPDMENCKAVLPLVEHSYQGKRMDYGGEKLTVLDAQGQCIEMVYRDHA
jgi:hypothetical protein